MKEFIHKNKKKFFLILFLIIYGILFFSYNVTSTWDSSEYLGMADFIRNGEIIQKWIPHRGFLFPLLLFLGQPFGIKSKWFMLILMYIFWIAMIFGVFAIYKKMESRGLFENKKQKIVFAIIFSFIVIFNPIIFGYYHTMLTEFVGLTISVIICYLTVNWINYSWKDNKKQIIIYGILFSILTIFIYHIKQSLLPITVIPIIISATLSCINKCKKENIIVRIVTIFIVFITLLSSIGIWNNFMKDAGVEKSVIDERIKNKIIRGISELNKVCSNEDVKIEQIDDYLISNEEKQIIKDINNGTSEYKKFILYKNSNDKYFLYLTKDDYTAKEQIEFYFKVLITSPIDVIKSYKNRFVNIIFSDEEHPILLFDENSTIPIRIFAHLEGKQGCNPKYVEYIQPYCNEDKDNLFSTIYTEYVRRTIINYNIITKFSLIVTPILFIITFLIYIIKRKKIKENSRRILETLIILYATSFGLIFSYVVLGSDIVDRYTVPVMIIANLANIILLFLGYNKAKKIKYK